MCVTHPACSTPTPELAWHLREPLQMALNYDFIFTPGLQSRPMPPLQAGWQQENQAIGQRPSVGDGAGGRGTYPAAPRALDHPAAQVGAHLGVPLFGRAQVQDPLAVVRPSALGRCPRGGGKSGAQQTGLRRLGSSLKPGLGEGELPPSWPRDTHLLSPRSPPPSRSACFPVEAGPWGAAQAQLLSCWVRNLGAPRLCQCTGH